MTENDNRRSDNQPQSTAKQMREEIRAMAREGRSRKNDPKARAELAREMRTAWKAENMKPNKMASKRIVELMSVIIFILGIMLVSAVLLAPPPRAGTEAERIRSENNENAQQKENDRHWTSYTCAQSYIDQLLKNPRGAKYSPKSETSYSERVGISTISGWVDATNSFGATLRTSWSCELILSETTCKVRECDLE